MTSESAAEKRGLWEGVVQEPLRSALFCVFSVFWGDFLLQISQKFLSETAPPMQAFFREKTKGQQLKGKIVS